MKLALILFKYGVKLDDPCCYPLGFMYISAVLKKAGHDVTVLNLNLEDNNGRNSNTDNIPHDLVYTNPTFDAVLFTGFEEFGPAIKRDAELCRRYGIKTILGGALATYKPEEMLNHVDTVIIGEGENVICQALNSVGIVQGSKPNLDNLPLPDYEGFGINEYHLRHGYKYMGVLTSRGCPYDCRFCAQTCASQSRKLSHVFEEIDLYRAKYGVKTIVFNDNTLNLKKSRFMEICREMGKRKMGWCAAVRADVWDEEMARTAKINGLEYLVVGVESFNQHKLNSMNKRIKVDQIKRSLDSFHKHGIKYHGNILLGLPGETYQDIAQELADIPQGYNLYPMLVQPFIGTGYQQRSITKDQSNYLSGLFKRFAEGQNMSVYPEASNA